MVLDMLSILAMSSDPERLFSGAKITIVDRRNLLNIDTINALECLKSWLGFARIAGDEWQKTMLETLLKEGAYRDKGKDLYDVLASY